MNGLPKLNFPPIRMRAKRVGDELHIWDSLRRRYLLLTPEEWVRQHLIAYLQNQHNVPAVSIVQEYPVDINGLSQRADVVVVGVDAKPLMLVECKAADVNIDAKVFEQASRYNAVVGARYILLTNGKSHYLFCREGSDYHQLTDFPQLF